MRQASLPGAAPAGIRACTLSSHKNLSLFGFVLATWVALVPAHAFACTEENGRTFLRNIGNYPESVARFPQPCTLAMSDVSMESVRVRFEDRELQVTLSAERMAIHHDRNRFILTIAGFRAEAGGKEVHKPGDATVTHAFLRAGTLFVFVPDSRNSGRVGRIELKGLRGEINGSTVFTANGIHFFVPTCFPIGGPCPAATFEPRNLNVDAAATLSYLSIPELTPELPPGLRPWNIAGRIRLPPPESTGRLELAILAEGLGRLEASSDLADPGCAGCLPLVNNSSLHIRVPDRQLAEVLTEQAFKRLPMPGFLSRFSGMAVDVLSGWDGLHLRYAGKKPAPIGQALLTAAIDAIVYGEPD